MQITMITTETSSKLVDTFWASRLAGVPRTGDRLSLAGISGPSMAAWCKETGLLRLCELNSFLYSRRSMKTVWPAGSQLSRKNHDVLSVPLKITLRPGQSIAVSLNHALSSNDPISCSGDWETPTPKGPLNFQLQTVLRYLTIRRTLCDRN